MKSAIAKMLREQVKYAATHGYPNMDRRYAYKQAKKDYKASQAKDKKDFNILERE